MHSTATGLAPAEHMLFAPLHQCHHQNLGTVAHTLDLKTYELVCAHSQRLGSGDALFLNRRAQVPGEARGKVKNEASATTIGRRGNIFCTSISLNRNMP